jgi:hypothetical protein
MTKKEAVLLRIIDILIESGIRFGIKMNMEKPKLMRI